MDEVIAEVDYVCRRDGGRGAVREFADWVMKGKRLLQLDCLD